ncbi:SpoIIE family protein phosphatase [Streptomyces sp. NPDC020983]|uniref:SpoIIE family protein phosphatase n=1 Tax=Streptomyces sp. NPDC020983 TaxID=3365106 RepID=UPI00379C313F
MDDGTDRALRDVLDRPALLSAATTALAGTLDADAGTRRLARTPVPRLAGRCVVHAVPGRTVREVAVVHRDPARPADAGVASHAVAVPAPSGDGPLARALRGEGPLLPPRAAFPAPAAPGVSVGIDPTEDRTLLPAGAILLLHTDSLVERRGEVLDRGTTRLRREAASRAGEPVDALVEHLPRGTGADTDDDTALLAVRVPWPSRRAGGAPRVGHVHMRIPQHPPRLRAWQKNAPGRPRPQPAAPVHAPHPSRARRTPPCGPPTASAG